MPCNPSAGSLPKMTRFTPFESRLISAPSLIEEKLSAGAVSRLDSRRSISLSRAAPSSGRRIRLGGILDSPRFLLPSDLGRDLGGCRVRLGDGDINRRVAAVVGRLGRRDA